MIFVSENHSVLLIITFFWTLKYKLGKPNKQISEFEYILLKKKVSSNHSFLNTYKLQANFQISTINSIGKKNENLETEIELFRI